jgi:hypothetical protein
MAWVRERTILTEQPLIVGEVSANVCGISLTVLYFEMTTVKMKLRSFVMPTCTP